MHRLCAFSIVSVTLLAGAPAVSQTVDGGHSHSIVATPDGRVFTWGYNASGQLGDGTTTQRTIPTEVPGLTDVVAVSGGLSHTLALKSDGTVWAFGLNSDGQLGDGTTTTRTTPTQVVGLGNVVKIAAGWSHSVAIEGDGTVWTWGKNASGQLCDGTLVGSSTPVFSAALSGSSVIRAGGDHTLAVRPDGTVLACGGNARGQLGDGTTIGRPSGATMSGIANATGVDAGEYHSLVLLQDGTVRAVGGNDRGQLGDGSFTDRPTPVTVTGVAGISALHAGALHSLARTTNGEIYVWGYNYDGQVGDNTTGNRSTATQTPNIPAMAVAAAAGYHTIIVTSDGVVRAWAWNGRGQVGDNTLTNRKTPVPISGLNYAWFATPPVFSPGQGTFTTPPTVSLTTATPSSVIRYTTDGTTPTDASAAYTAPIPVATTTTFKAATFRTGWQASPVTTAVYTLNYGTLAAPSLTPATGSYVSSVDVTMSAAAGATVRYTLDGTDPTGSSSAYTAPVAVDRSTTVKARAFRVDYGTSAATTATYTVVVADPVLSLPAGEYPGGQAVTLLDPTPDAVLHYTITGADPTEADPALAPGGTIVLGNFLLKVRAYKTGCAPSQVRSASYTVTGSVSAPAVAAGNGFSLVLTSDGTVWAWGYNGQGQLGDGSLVGHRFPARVLGLTGIGAVAAGGSYAFALRQDGRLHAWGENQGWLGDDTSTRRTSPVAVSGMTDGRDVASRASHSLAVRADGTVWSWGRNWYGELGDGTTTPRSAPVPVSGLSNALAVASGEYASTALTADGHVWGWGLNTYGQVGDGTTTTRLVPVAVTGLSDVIAVAAGIGHRLALTSDGTVWAWGLNSNGQIGDGTRTGRPTPVPVPGLTNVVRIAAGGWHSFAVTSDGTLWAWGGNGSGQLGDGTTTERWSPTPIAGLPPVVAVGASTAHSLAVVSDGSVWTWGRNQDGELGDGTTVWRSSPAAISGPGDWRVVTPILSLASGTYPTERSVTVTCADPSAVLHYTTTGLDPSESDGVITSGAAVAVDRSLTLKVRAWKPGAPASLVATGVYELKVVPPVLTPLSGAYTAPLSVTASTSTAGATLRVTTDGTEPLTTSEVLSAPLPLLATATVKVKAAREGWTTSDTAVASYYLAAVLADGVTISPNGGAFSEPPFVVLSSARPEATIRYTLDGTEPAWSSARYLSPVKVTLGTTLKARLFEVGATAGPVSTATFAGTDATISAAPILAPAGGTFTTRRSVAVTAPADAVLRYTTTGADPGDTDPVVPVSRTILVDRSLVLKVRAWQPGLSPSPVRRADFAITGAAVAGDFFSLALAADGTVWAWGSNAFGQLGDGTSTYRFAPIQVPGLADVVAVAAGDNFALALNADGTVWSWGQNNDGELGDGTITTRHSPVQVLGLSNVTAIAGGDHHGLAATSDGTVWSWGSNDTGQLGDGTTTNRTSPVPVLGLGGVSIVRAGDGFSLAVETGGEDEGRVWAWGRNDKGQVGDGATASRLVPVRVPGAPVSRSVTAGADWTAAVANDGTVWTWGGNASGQLGTGFGANRLAPAPIPALPPMASVNAGDAFALAVDRQGTVWGWGDNGAGQFGMSAGTCPNGPCDVLVRVPWTAPLAVAPGAWFSIVVATDGSVWAAGANASGQLGTGTSQPSEVLVPSSGLSLVANTWLTTDEDGDGLTAWREWLAGTDPWNADTNGNGVPDGIELAAGGGAANTDCDGDGVADELEVRQGTDPFVIDTDGDGVSDALDAFPLDPLRAQPLAPDPNDHTPPVVTLTAPANARPIR